MKLNRAINQQGFSLIEVVFFLGASVMITLLASSVVVQKDLFSFKMSKSTESLANIILPVETMRNDIKMANTITKATAVEFPAPYVLEAQNMLLYIKEFDTTTNSILNTRILYEIVPPAAGSSEKYKMKRTLQTETAPSGSGVFTGNKLIEFVGIEGLKWCIDDTFPRPADCPNVGFPTLGGTVAQVSDKRIVGEFLFASVIDPKNPALGRAIQFIVDAENKSFTGNNDDLDVLLVRESN